MYSRTRDRERTGERVPKRTAPSHPILALQASAGNQAVAAMVARFDPETMQRRIEVQFAGVDELLRLIRELGAVPNEDETVTVRFGQLGVERVGIEEAVDLSNLATSRLPSFFTRFADGRAPLYAAMRAAADTAARRVAILALRAYDEPELPKLWRLHDYLGGWKIEDAPARDAVLAAIQLRIATDAEGELNNNRNEVHQRVVAHAGMSMDEEWCGFFAQEEYRKSRLDTEFNGALFETRNVRDFFTYNEDPINIGRTPRWIFEEGRWQSVHDYHQTRGSLRTWQDNAALVAAGEHDIRPGDIVLFDWNADGMPDHIATVLSYDPTTATVFTIGGNDGGYVIDKDHTYNAAGEGAAETQKRQAGEAATGESLKPEGMLGGGAGGHVGVGVRVIGAQFFGIGRPSLVDFEHHIYDHHDANQHKAPAKPPP
jgi:hypothetical protein